MRRYPAILVTILAAAVLAACGGGDDSGSTDEIVNSRSVPTATLPPSLPTPLIVGSEGFRLSTELGGTIGGRGTYTVVSGDSFNLVAQKNGVTVQELLGANGLTTDSVLRVGQVLVIPSSTTIGTDPTGTPAATRTPTNSAAPTTTPRPSTQRQTYVVQPGDNANDIADRYGVTVAELARANGMTTEQMARLSIGLELIIP